MSKRTRAEKLIKEEELYQKSLLKNGLIMKVVKESHKKNKSNVHESDFISLSFLNEIRDRKLWKKKSYNKEVQKREFLKYLYFKYEAPVWALEALITLFEQANKSNEPIDKIEKSLLMNLNFINILDNKMIDLLKIAMEGTSFKESLGKFLTKKELHFFVNSKEESIELALLEAKLKYFNLNKNKLDFLKQRFENHNLFKNDLFSYNGKRSNSYLELLLFFAKNANQLDNNSMQEIYDYFVHLIPYRIKNGYIMFEQKEILAKDFFKKSLGTIIKLSNDYHLRIIKTKNNTFLEWDKTYDDLIIDNKYLFKELINSRELEKEGSKMKHCVGGYAKKCFLGSTKIISLQNLEDNMQNLLTIEIYNNKIVQVKGKLNRSATNLEENIVYKFALNYDLKYSSI